jgi:hypothetical protein
MQRGQSAVSRERHTKSMSRKTTVGIATVVVLGSVAGAYYWLHTRGERPVPEVVSAEPQGFREPVAAEKPASTGAEKPASAADANKSTPPADPGLPLRAGEVLEFTANVAKVNNVASLKVQVAGKGNFLGKSAWHLQASAHTQNPLRMIFELDDQFDSYSDAGTLVSMQYEMHLNERGQKVESVQRMTATGKDPAPADATEARVMSGTRDPLGMMQYLRNVDWSKKPEVRGPVYDGHKLYDVRARLAGSSADVTVPAGSYKASKIEIRVFDNDLEMKDASFNLFLANNSARTPVLLEATLPFATARVELVKAK